MPERGILYYSKYTKHAAMLVVSIASVRSRFKGPIRIACGDDRAAAVAEKIASDRRLAPIDWERITPAYDTNKKGANHCSKTYMADWTPFDETVFLDADTLVVSDFDELWPRSEYVVLTRFADWWTTGSKMRSRIKRWREHMPKEVAVMLGHENTYPAINTGTMGFHKESPFMREWPGVCSKNVSFMGDEISANLMFPWYPHIVLDDRFNFSPLYSIEHNPNHVDVRIYHFHGFKHARPDRCPNGVKVWHPAYIEACDQNYAEVRHWGHVVDGYVDALLHSKTLSNERRNQQIERLFG